MRHKKPRTPPTSRPLSPHHPALIPVSGLSAEWIDSMILAGRLQIGLTVEDHQWACRCIRVEQTQLSLF